MKKLVLVSLEALEPADNRRMAEVKEGQDEDHGSRLNELASTTSWTWPTPKSSITNALGWKSPTNRVLAGV
jgi:hypothetical protein